MNELSLFFGPRLPDELDTLGIAFVSAPAMQPDYSIGSLSAQRYVRQNYPHLEKHTVLSSASANQTVDVSFSYGGTTVGGLYANSLSFSSSGSITLDEDAYGIEVLNMPIRVRGITITKGGSWMASIVPGTVVRPHIISANEPSTSWIKRAMTALGSGTIAVGDKVYLIYTVPEARYGTQATDASTTFPGTAAQLRTAKEIGQAVSPTSIGFAGTIKVLTKIKVNGVTKFSGSFDGTGSDTYVKGFDNALHQIHIKGTIEPNDFIELEYKEFAGTYEYSGFRTFEDIWYAFDTNPEHGHYIADDRDHVVKPSSDMLLEEITIYLIPSALVVVKITDPDELDPETYGGAAAITFISAYNYGETHFIRHKIGGIADEAIVSRQTDGSQNTWGHAVLGVNHYDEGVYFADDVFDPKHPSAMPLGRMVLAAPAATSSVSIADIRNRGGGVPEDYPLAAVQAESDGLDRLRMHWDMGIWEGKAIKEGGVIEIQIDKSVLTINGGDYTSSEVEAIVRSQVPPGIAFEIKYVTF